MNKTTQQRIDSNILLIDIPNKQIKGYTKAGKWKEQFNKIIDLLEED